MDNKNNNPDRKSIVHEENFVIKKKFSQNFLLDENIIHNIIDKAEIDDQTGVIEIGPGLGALTKIIIKQAKKLLVYEIDAELIEYLNKFFSEYDNFYLRNEDILKVDINSDIKTYLQDVKKIVVISNLPYHITTPITMKFLEEVDGIDSLILMMQLEVARRITSKPNTKDYNALSIIIQHQAEAKYLFKVPKTVFYPKPNVDSAVIKLVIKDINNHDYIDFYKFIHNCFIQRRKTLVNNLNFVYSNIPKEFIVNILEELGLNSLARAESLELADFINIYKNFKEF